jgi:hypothetical protein
MRLMFRTVAICAITSAIASFNISLAFADLSVDGSRDHLRVQAKDASLDDVLAALRDRYGLVYRTDVPLNQTITGNYSGTLESVLAQLTRNYDHALKIKQGVVELIFTNQAKSTAKPPPLTVAASSSKGVSSVTSMLETQARQIAANSGASGVSGGANGAAAGATVVGSTAGPSSSGSPSSMAAMTQQASSTVRELAQALSKVSISN